MLPRIKRYFRMKTLFLLLIPAAFAFTSCDTFPWHREKLQFYYRDSFPERHYNQDRLYYRDHFTRRQVTSTVVERRTYRDSSK